MSDRAKAFLDGLRASLRREELPPPPATPAQAAAVNVLLRAIFAPEPLPFDPEPKASASRSVLSSIFGLEALGHDAPAPPPHRTRWFNLLFRPEHLDD